MPTTLDDAQTRQFPTDAEDVTLQEVLDHVRKQDERIDTLEDELEWVREQLFALGKFVTRWSRCVSA